MSPKVFPWSRREPALPRVTIQTGRIILREKRLEDAQDDYAWRTDKELSDLGATTPLRITFDEFLRFYREEVTHNSPSSYRMAIDTVDGKHIGNIMCYDIDHGRGQTELGIMIGDRDFWSQGYGTETVRALVEHIFRSTTFKRIYLHTLEWNHRAKRSFTKAGFQSVKPVTRWGHDFILMEILRDQWLEQQGKNNEDPAPSSEDNPQK